MASHRDDISRDLCPQDVRERDFGRDVTLACQHIKMIDPARLDSDQDFVRAGNWIWIILKGELIDATVAVEHNRFHRPPPGAAPISVASLRSFWMSDRRSQMPEIRPTEIRYPISYTKPLWEGSSVKESSCFFFSPGLGCDAVVESVQDWRQAEAIRPSVSAVIWRNGRLLLQKRADGGQWGLPGGSVEIGESVAAATLREVVEETGFRVQVGRLIGVYSDPAFQVVRYPDGRVWHYVNLCFECLIVDGEFATSAETLALDFFVPDQLPAPLVTMHRIRIQDALVKQVAPFIR
jgi:ADP-ribose pyrophosphatase YjhB (NUDIX family)